MIAMKQSFINSELSVESKATNSMPKLFATEEQRG